MEQTDWEQVRIQAAIAAMQGMMANQDPRIHWDNVPQLAVVYADALIEELKKEKKRVGWGKEYYFININFQVESDYEYGADVDNLRFDSNNYFIIKEEAEAMAYRLRAVLNGADVIEMPSENESLEAMPQNMSVGQRVGWSSCYYWLKSKIIK